MGDYLSDKMRRFTRRIVMGVFGLVGFGTLLAFALLMSVLAHRLVHWMEGVPLS